MDDYRFIQVQDEEEQEQMEIEENLAPEEIMVPENLNDELENDDNIDYDDNDDDYEDYDDDDDVNDNDDYDEDDYEDEIDAYEREEVDEVIPVPVVMTSPRVSNAVLLDSEGRNFDINKSETDDLLCPICFEAWTNSGDHQICCLPCGHLYGLSCIKKWLQKRRNFGKCPQCNNVSTLKDVRILYVNRLCVADEETEELHKRLRSLEAKCAHLEQKKMSRPRRNTTRSGDETPPYTHPRIVPRDEESMALLAPTGPVTAHEYLRFRDYVMESFEMYEDQWRMQRILNADRTREIEQINHETAITMRMLDTAREEARRFSMHFQALALAVTIMMIIVVFLLVQY